MVLAPRQTLKASTVKTDRIGVWGAIFLSVLVSSGQLKATVLFNWMPADLTFIAAAIVGVSVVRSRLVSGGASPFIFLPIMLWAVFLLPLLYTPPGSDAEKLTLLFTVTLLLAIAPFYILRTQAQRRAFLWTTVIIGVLTAGLVLITGTTVEGYASRFILEGTDTIGTARLAGAGGIICLVFALTRGRRTSHRLVLITAGSGLTILAFATGSRGPVLAAAVSLVFVALFSSEFKRYRIRVAVAVAAIGSLTFIIASAQSSEGFDRILQYFSSADSSTLARSTLTSQALQTIAAHPEGIGWGNFSASNGLFLYPHNFFLEVPMEGGWLAGILVAALLIAAGVRYFSISEDPTQAAMAALLVFSAINASVSSDVNGNRLLWVTMFTAFAMTRTPKQSESRTRDRQGA